MGGDPFEPDMWSFSFNPEAPPMITSVLGQLKAATKIALYLFVAFLVIRLWQDPAGSADATVNFINSIGSFFSSAIDKLSLFVRGLGK
jgi:hypothetical protein